MNSLAGIPLLLLAMSLCLFAAALPPAQATPLTLEAALATVDSSHPELLQAKAGRDSAQADQQMVRASQDASLDLEGTLRSGHPTAGGQGFTPDNSLRLTGRKTLYDFGRSSNAELAAQYELNAREQDLTTARDNLRLEIMTRYFDVLLADMQYMVDNEMMSVDYVSYDQGKDKLEKGMISSVDLAELESIYREALLKRNASAQRQRITRALLANAMNRPGNLPGELEDPKLAGNQAALPDYETLLPVMLENNPRLQAQHEMLAASLKRLESLRASKNPILAAEVQAADYSRTASTRDSLSAGVILSWPLYEGSRVDSRIEREMARFNELQASTEKLKMELIQALLETCLNINLLQDSTRNAANKYSEYRDQQLERSRGLYELEFKSNLGTSMVGTAEAKMKVRNVEYQLALGFARLEALLGKPLSQSGVKQGE